MCPYLSIRSSTVIILLSIQFLNASDLPITELHIIRTAMPSQWLKVITSEKSIKTAVHTVLAIQISTLDIHLELTDNETITIAGTKQNL
jgi:hypothetical protein